MTNNDRENLEAFIRGDRSGAQALISGYARPLTNHAAQMLSGDRARAEDIVQEAFVKLWRHAQKLLEKEELYVRAWLFRVVTNAAIDFSRKYKEVDDTVLEFMPSSAPSVETQLIRSERASLAMKLVEELPDRQRAAVLMSHFESMGNQEIAVALEVSVEAIESLLGRARRSLKARALELKEAM